MKLITPKRTFLTLAGLLILGLIVYGLRPQPHFVSTFTVVEAPLSVVIEEEGKTRLIDRYQISAPIDGFAQRIAVRAGDYIQQGQPLVTLEPLYSGLLDARSQAVAEAHLSAAEGALKAAQESVTAAQAEAKLAAAEFKRLKKLYQEQVIMRSEYERALAADSRARAALRSAVFNAQVAEFDLEAARVQAHTPKIQADGLAARQQTTVHSPIDGQILRLLQESEGVVRMGETLLEIGNLSALEVIVELLSSDAVRLRPGLDVKLEYWGGPTLDGIVQTIEPTAFTKVSALGVEEQRVNVIVAIRSPLEARPSLGDGYRVTAQFILWEDEQILQIPSSALFRSGEGWSVFTVVDDKAKKQTVSTGRQGGLNVQVLDGLNVDDRVIIHPDPQLAEGSSVRLTP